MVKSLLAASVAAFALIAPAAHADPPQYDCNFISVEDPTREEDWHTGVVVGYVVHAGFVSIRCDIVSGGVVVAPGPSSSGVGAAAVAEQWTFTGEFGPDTELCATATTDHGTYDHCRELA